MRGPFRVWLHSPELCDRVEALGAFARFDSALPLRLRELSLLWCAPGLGIVSEAGEKPLAHAFALSTIFELDGR